MGRQLILARKTILWLFIIASLLWYFWDCLSPKVLDNSDVVIMKKGHYDDSSKFFYIGIKNVCKDRPNQYKNFLPVVAAHIADTTTGKINIYFLIYANNIEQRVQYWHPYELMEEVPDMLLLKEDWDGSKQPTFTRWYVPALKSLNSEVHDILHLEDTRVEQVK